jgi:hypothetical protein
MRRRISMRERPIEFEERALDKLVVNEFELLEKKPLRQPESIKKSAPQGPGKIIQITPSTLSNAGEETFDEEENKFVKDAIDWLRPRDNKDAIIGRIWDLLIESEPEEFYAPETEDARNETEPVNVSGNSAIITTEPIQGKEKII